MEKFFTHFKNLFNPFAKDEEGSQVVEYALIIAVVSIGLVLALSNTTSGIGTSFSNLVDRLKNCFTAGIACT